MSELQENTLVSLLDASAVTALQDATTAAWHGEATGYPLKPANELMAAVLELHRANFELWHIEDQARVPGASDRQIAETKRAIDKVNQRRNDLAEQTDVRLLETLEAHGLPRAAAELHSESPGLMLDRLSILALKIYHTREEVQRENAPEGHRQRNEIRLAVLLTQRDDLAGCLGALWQNILSGERRFKVYRQMKMYNDPSLNPAVYGTQKSPAGTPEDTAQKDEEKSI
ncbi:DUF4254 domain-containing protein [Silvibacterium dinghuense]|uniref:DUF4254 domain-containing protein n=1 Tax=Silvibacterium dinghuense TaxID=1560006 RepID=A0A4Q1SE14_9BACT|nr:DUF4254 domain-containing protein [Silvibacterium dinghuense]RXS95499.1 DUF4254 domain-containing protein [Silvibacterium dinghuense]GGH13605.1 hypothetical protein GCM10011586_33580 [Silvibacterium dinghuense]